MAAGDSYGDNTTQTIVMAYDSVKDTWSQGNVTSLTDLGGSSVSFPDINSPPTGAATASGSGSSSRNDSQTQAEKKFIEIEFNTLSGSLEVIANSTTIKMREGDTLVLEGLGKYLSGQFFITEVERSIDDSSGYSQRASILRTGFGPTFKSVAPINDATPAVPNGVIQVGTKVVISGAAVFGVAHDGYKVPKWVKDNSTKGMYYVTQIDKAYTRCLLQNVGYKKYSESLNSWVYIQFLTPY